MLYGCINYAPQNTHMFFYISVYLGYILGVKFEGGGGWGIRNCYTVVYRRIIEVQGYSRR